MSNIWNSRLPPIIGSFWCEIINNSRKYGTAQKRLIINCTLFPISLPYNLTFHNTIFCCSCCCWYYYFLNSSFFFVRVSFSKTNEIFFFIDCSRDVGGGTFNRVFVLEARTSERQSLGQMLYFPFIFLVFGFVTGNWGPPIGFFNPVIQTQNFVQLRNPEGYF